jgi:hypothetical protein
MPDEEKEEFADTEILPENVDKLIPDKNIKDENTKNTKNTKNNNELILKGNTILDDIQVSEIDIQDTKELREIIDKNSSEIADLKKRNKENFDGSNPSTPRKIKYIYSNIFDEKEEKNKEWSDIKRYRFQKCLWKLKYNRIVSSFYLNNLKNSEHKWSWMIIVISTMTSGLTVANNVDQSNAPFVNYNTCVNILLSVSSMSTSLIAAWIKKQMFIEKINEVDKYLYELNALCEDLEIQLSLLNTDRLKYEDFKKAYIPRMTQYLTTNPIIPPLEWKKCIKEITLDYPELLNIDDSEDNKMWPWYGDLISDPNNYNDDAPHVRYPTTFYEKFRKTPKDKYLSSCCGKKQMKVVYDCDNNNP